MIKGNLNGKGYEEQVLVPFCEEIEERFDLGEDGERIDQKVLFDDRHDWVFQQDFATSHATNANETLCSYLFPKHTPVLKRLSGHPLYIPPKFDDFWWQERVWGMMCQIVYRSPEPRTVPQLMRRVHEAHQSITVDQLTRLVHESPARMQKIYELKGGKIPKGWKASSSKLACKCTVCRPDL